MKPYFINEAFDKAINDYLISKDNIDSPLYESFLVVVIRMLINIYGELDILNPFYIKDEEAFTDNLMKYGAKKENIDSLKRLVDGFYQIDKRNKNAVKSEINIYFIEVQKSLIDLFTLKRVNFGLTENESKEFFNLLYTPGTNSFLRISYNFKNAEDIYEVAEYYKESLKEKEKTKEQEDKKNILGFDIYKLFNYSIADISKMSSKDVDKLNSEIYESFDINENAINKEYLLEEKMREIQMQQNPITTGNGYVDILLIMSVIVTSIMVVIIFGAIIF